MDDGLLNILLEPRTRGLLRHLARCYTPPYACVDYADFMQDGYVALLTHQQPERLVDSGYRCVVVRNSMLDRFRALRGRRGSARHHATVRTFTALRCTPASDVLPTDGDGAGMAGAPADLIRALSRADEGLQQLEDREFVRWLLAWLPARMQAVLYDRVFAGLSYEEMAPRYALTPGTLKIEVVQAYARLRRLAGEIMLEK